MNGTGQTIIQLQGVGKSFGGREVLPPLDLDIYHGEFITLLGPSGCGKTTLLRLIGGFEQPDAGRVLLAGSDITDLPPNQRPVNTVFQSYALFPHMTVFENVAYGLRAEQRPEDEIRTRVAQVLAMVQMIELAERKPDQLSGGQQQRVAIARALINDPPILVADEPTGSLDSITADHIFEVFEHLVYEQGKTIIMVTHDNSLAPRFSRHVTLVDGEIVSDVDTARAAGPALVSEGGPK